MLLGNPHFPWQGSERWYEMHLTIPGKLDAIGAGLQGVPVVNIGFNKHVAWSHTVSTARRFTPYELKLKAGDPTQLPGRREGREDEAAAPSRCARRPASSGTRSTRRAGGRCSTSRSPGSTWTAQNAYALADVNADNFRLTNQWVEYDMAKSVGDLRRASAKVQGNPWVNVIAADSAGRAYYADDSVVPNVDSALQKRCSTSSKAPLLLTAGVILLDGSKQSCAWGNDRDAVAKGILGPKALPRATRRDYVENSNDSYWLPSARFRLAGFPRIIGPEGTARLLRTRLGLVQAEQRLAGTDGLGEKGFTIDTMKAVFNANRNLSAELAKDAVVQGCTASAAPDLLQACAVLAAWDGHADVGSRGAVLWRETWSRLAAAGVPWTVPFDPADPVNTPRDLNGSDPKVTDALRGAVEDLRAKGIAARRAARRQAGRAARQRADRDPRLLGGRGLLQHHLDPP